MLNAKIECHMIGLHALSHEVSTFIYTNRCSRASHRYEINLF